MAPVNSRYSTTPTLNTSVAVHDQVALHEGQCATELQYQRHALADIERTTLAVAVDGLTLDQLGDQPWRAVLGNAGVQQRGDIGMTKPGQHLRLLVKALLPVRAPQGRAEQLECHLGIEGASARTARHTADMPPRPSRDCSWQWPMVRPSRL